VGLQTIPADKSMASRRRDTPAACRKWRAARRNGTIISAKTGQKTAVGQLGPARV